MKSHGITVRALHGTPRGTRHATAKRKANTHTFRHAFRHTFIPWSEHVTSHAHITMHAQVRAGALQFGSTALSCQAAETGPSTNCRACLHLIGMYSAGPGVPGRSERACFVRKCNGLQQQLQQCMSRCRFAELRKGRSNHAN